MPTHSTLTVQHLGKHYGGTPVFAQVHFAVQPGEFVAIVGDSGVGKSTLLNCLAGLDQWDEGDITYTAANGTATRLADLDDTARVQAMLDAVGLGALGSRLPQQLSGGQLQRVAIARALVHRPGLLLADEPTGNLDPTTAALVMDLLLAQTREQGASLVLVTHSDAAAARADRVLRLTASGMVG